MERNEWEEEWLKGEPTDLCQRCKKANGSRGEGGEKERGGKQQEANRWRESDEWIVL